MVTGYLRYDSTTPLSRRIISLGEMEEWSSNNRYCWWEFEVLDTPWKRLKAWARIWFVR